VASTGQKFAIGCGGAVALVVVGLVILGIMAAPPDDVEVYIDAPVEVANGQQFVIEARVTNLANERQILVDLDVADAYLEGIVIERTDPPFTEAFHVPIDNTFSYSVDVPIPAGEEVTVRLYAYAARPGDFNGYIDFCINSEIKCVQYPMRTIVK
jgi:hypothetical protein